MSGEDWLETLLLGPETVTMTTRETDTPDISQTLSDKSINNLTVSL